MQFPIPPLAAIVICRFHCGYLPSLWLRSWSLLPAFTLTLAVILVVPTRCRYGWIVNGGYIDGRHIWSMGGTYSRWAVCLVDGVCVLHGGIGLSSGDVVGGQNVTCLVGCRGISESGMKEGNKAKTKHGISWLVSLHTIWATHHLVPP